MDSVQKCFGCIALADFFTKDVDFKIKKILSKCGIINCYMNEGDRTKRLSKLVYSGILP